MRFRYLLLELLTYWLEPHKPDKGEWAPVLCLMTLVLEGQAIAALYVTGAFKPL